MIIFLIIGILMHAWYIAVVGSTFYFSVSFLYMLMLSDLWVFHYADNVQSQMHHTTFFLMETTQELSHGLLNNIWGKLFSFLLDALSK